MFSRKTRRSRSAQPFAMLEPVESRTMMSVAPAVLPAVDANDQISEARTVTASRSGTRVNDDIGGAADVDMFRVQVSAGQRLSFDTDFGTAPALAEPDTFIRLFDSTGRQIASNDDAAAPGESGQDPFESYLQYTFRTGGNYYLGVSDFGNQQYNAVTGGGDNDDADPWQDVRGNYTLTVRDTTPGDSDDQISEAVRVNVGTSRTGNIDVPRDVDMYRVTLAAGQTINLDLDRTSGSDLDSVLRVFDRSGNQLAFNDDALAPGESDSSWLESYLPFTAPRAGDYYVSVSGYMNSSFNPVTGAGDQDGDTGGYRLTFGDGDNDDQIREARRLTLGGVQNGTISYGADVDMYSFRATVGQTIDISAVARSGSELDPEVRLFDSSGRVLATNDDDGFSLDSFLSYEVTRDGTYYVGVSAYPNHGYNASSGAGDQAGNSTGAYMFIVSEGLSFPDFTSSTAARPARAAQSSPFAGEVPIGVNAIDVADVLTGRVAH